MGGMKTLRQFVGKIISIWCGEFEVDGSELMAVLTVESVEDGWLRGTLEPDPQDKGRSNLKQVLWFNIREIVYFQEGDCFSTKKEHLEVLLTKHDKEGEI